MTPVLIAVLRALILIVFMLVNVIVLILMLRKVLGHLHARFGPMELGPHGAFQTFADILKIVTKGINTPGHVDKPLYLVAPAMILVPAIAGFTALPFSHKLVAADLDLGLLYTIAIMGLMPMGTFAAGWASNNKWGTIGASRAIAGVAASEVPRLLSAIPVVMLARSINMGDIVLAQQESMWNVLLALPCFVVFLITSLIDGRMTPFDMTEAESELIAGYANEYSGMRFGMLYVAEFSDLFVIPAIMVTLFLGGWTLPFVPNGWWSPLIFVAKVYLVIFFIMWVRGTLPRIRIDQMLALCWKVLVPVTLVWIMLTGVGLKIFQIVTGGA